MRILAIDPGTEKSAYVVYETCLIDLQDIREMRNVVEFGLYKNEDMLSIISSIHGACLVIEMIACYGMPVGKTVFETCVWIGRFIEAKQGEHTFAYRKDVKMHLCNSMRAKDSNIRQAIIDRYPPVGGGKCPQVGTKKKQGPLYGVRKDIWSALAVAIYYSDTIKGA